MRKEFHQIVWDNQLEKSLEILIKLAIEEDLGGGDCTSFAVVPEAATAGAKVVARQPGIVAGLPGFAVLRRLIDDRLEWRPAVEDGQFVEPGETVGLWNGPARSILAAERIALNLLGRLSGIATLTRRYVEAVAGTSARVYDTRKTLPGWRRLEKYAVRCGGGQNHRGGLDQAVLIKDNHLAIGTAGSAADAFSPAEAVTRARQFLKEHVREGEVLVEIEVDTLEQLEQVLPRRPDIVLLDNMSLAQLKRAVACRNAAAPEIELEASGGINLETVAAIARTGVERISVGALTHSAVSLDFGLDWLDVPAC